MKRKDFIFYISYLSWDLYCPLRTSSSFCLLAFRRYNRLQLFDCTASLSHINVLLQHSNIARIHEFPPHHF